MRNKAPSRHTVAEMFNRIAPTYDWLNAILSFGLDRRWRKIVTKYLLKRPDSLLVDLATGTCDQIIALRKIREIKSFIGLDLSEKMLSLGKKKIDDIGLSSRVTLELGSALDIPLDSNSASAVTISFGIRNVTSPPKCLSEMYRILQTGGQVLILEFARPTSRIVKKGYLFYLRHVLPRIGKYISNDPEAYTYLNETIEEFPCGEEFLSLMKEASFRNTRAISLTFGIVNLYVGEK